MNADELRRAWFVAGPRPDLHQQAKDRLRREWPTLHHAIVHLVHDEESQGIPGPDGFRGPDGPRGADGIRGPDAVPMVGGTVLDSLRADLAVRRAAFESRPSVWRRLFRRAR